MSTRLSLRHRVKQRFSQAGIIPHSVEVRTFPGEVIVIVEVIDNYEQALEVAHELDKSIEDGFITIKRAHVGPESGSNARVSGVHDSRVNRVVELLSSRARTSESQPSLRYIPDVAERINVAMSPRHHLVFGRRGVGKTALMLEARRRLTGEAHVLWINMHPLRSLNQQEAFLSIAARVCDLGLSTPKARSYLSEIRDTISEQQAQHVINERVIAKLVPWLQQALSRFCIESGISLYIFVDDIHYMKVSEVPGLLDLLHGISRDNPVWLKVAAIRHQTRWFTQTPPTGLQTGHDAEIINLDITLEQPARAKIFLQDILLAYLESTGVKPIRSILGNSAVDRLVLASGGVPRDFLSLCASALQIARSRPNARAVGVQDVNNAAGQAAQVKLQELEDDAAAAREGSQAYVNALNTVRDFLLNEKQITFLRIDFMDKEERPDEYTLMQALMDLRMLHLVNSSLSDPHHAGRRSEVYLLDLSQYSGARLKQRLRVLDFEKDHLVLKRTRSETGPRIGDSPRRLVELLRRGPLFELSRLSPR